ncbi:hypothetical protein BC624_1088 [Flavobacterium granuli]|uniref:Uncharacterized protein n=1 Tax=Flavobacterium granuli TaxID=280093 RepID=A0A1M5R0Z6_9FLAO|nr:hypothetical protein BC624_1088 [Flavobacterium granuli]SHH20032.1 hypothetical protein SAMN05443373_1098 [Flavobacterium granuli]
MDRNMGWIIFFVIVLIILIYALYLSLRKKLFLRDYLNQDAYSKASTIKYYFILTGLIFALICLIYTKLMDFFNQ